LRTLDGSDNDYVIRNSATQQCLDVPGASRENGAKLIVWNCNGGKNQNWRYRVPGAG
jgi:hypothetical protein